MMVGIGGWGMFVVLRRIAAMAALSAACAMLLAGCATITKGTSQLVAVNTPGVAGAVCTISTSSGPQMVTTPGTVTLSKGSASLPIQCVKECYVNGTSAIFERRSNLRGQCHFRRSARAWRRRGQRRAQQVSRSGHGGDDARSRLPEVASFAPRAAANLESLTHLRDSLRALACFVPPVRWKPPSWVFT